jgi:hypothetical protein
MKVTKRIAKEVHNEKQKSYDMGFEEGQLSERKKFGEDVSKAFEEGGEQMKKRILEIIDECCQGEKTSIDMLKNELKSKIAEGKK